jgi:putative colanic acid biosynthesis acetyltransferase WcaF
MTTLARNISPWTTRQKIGRMLWKLVYSVAFLPSFPSSYRWRAMLLRLFGARLGTNVRFRRTVKIEIPWHLTIGSHVSIGDRAILYALGKITIGDRSFVSQYAHLCAGTHDYRTSDYPLIRSPITIGEDVWIAADAFVGPGVTIADRALVGARAVVVKDVPEQMIVAGNPARVIKQREWLG